jgi:hypothetical protein
MKTTRTPGPFFFEFRNNFENGETIPTFIERLRKWHEELSHPKRVSDLGTLQIFADRSYESEDMCGFRVQYEREETDEEFEKRTEQEQAKEFAEYKRAQELVARYEAKK